MRAEGVALPGFSVVFAVTIAAAASGSGTGDNLLILSAGEIDDRCVEPGEPVTVTLSMDDLSEPVVGYQAFLSFDPQVLTFVSGEYILPDPFGLPLVYPITASPGGEIDVIAGILFGVQPPAVDPADLAILHFLSGPEEDRTVVGFRPHTPPTQFSGADDEPVSPTLRDTPVIIVTSDTSTEDTDGDGVTDPCDMCEGCDDHDDADGDGIPDGCDQLGDFDHDADVDLADHASFLGCMTGPSGGLLNDCEVFDWDEDLDVDLLDFGALQVVFAQPTCP